jgi:hypothetical protein
MALKKIFILFLICIPFFLPAQNYQNICTPGTTFFKNSSGSILAFRRDSVLPTSSHDTVFISYRTRRDTIANVWPNYYCVDTTNGGILGRKIYKKHDGWFYFFNRHNDTIRINSQAALNESWSFCDLPDFGYIQARVTSIVSDSVLGTTDPVKIISFQAKNQLNNDIPHFLNDKSIRLSQHYGLSIMLDVFSIPDGTVFYSVCGNTGTGLGIQDFSMKDVYNFDIGDVFHYSGNSNNQGKECDWKIINTILGKTVYGNTDSVSYLMMSCEFEYGDLCFNMTYGTTTVNYNIIGLDGDPTYSRLPNELYGRDAFSRTVTVKSISNNYYINYGYCWEHPYYLNNENNQYSPGLGCIKRSGSGDYYYWSESLVYYEKGSQTWGTPVANDCSDLLGIEYGTQLSERLLRVIPNPIYTKAEISISGEKVNPGVHLTLYNSYGIQIFRDIFSSNPYFFQRNGINTGLYLLVVTDDEGKIIGKEKVILL